MQLLKEYPVAASELLHFPLMFPQTMRGLRLPGLPLAKLEFLYEVGEGLGLSPGTVRTALSRMRKEGYLETVKEGSVTRYRVSPLQLEVMDNFMRRPARGRDGYAVAVYSFESSQERQRALARSLLECEGFVRFARNFLHQLEDRRPSAPLEAPRVGTLGPGLHLRDGGARRGGPGADGRSLGRSRASILSPRLLSLREGAPGRLGRHGRRRLPPPGCGLGRIRRAGAEHRAAPASGELLPRTIPTAPWAPT